MNITKENIDALNVVVKVDIVADDYQEKVTKILTDYRKKADIPGFRKGHVPMGIVKKQYGKSVIADEVNKLLEDALNKFLTEEKLDILGNPLPRIKEDFNWNAENFSFEFELGLAPEFDVNLKSKTKVTQYKIIVTDELIDEEVENIQTRYGKTVFVEEATEHSKITGDFLNEEKEIDKKYTFLVNDLKGKKNRKKVIGTKVGDVIELDKKKLFENNDELQLILGVSDDEIDNLETKITLTIEEITETEPADLDKELFDKAIIDGSVNTVTELKELIREDAEKQFQLHADLQLLNAVKKHLVENTKFDLPAKFIQKWMTTVDEKNLTLEEAIEEYNKLEKGLRYQLIETKIMEDNDINLEYAEVLDHAKGFVRRHMEQYGNLNLEEKELNDVTAKILQNPKEFQKFQKQLLDFKLLVFYKENMDFKTKEISLEDFIKEVI